MSRIYLSPPHLSGTELKRLREALDSNWVAPVGPQVDAFEQEFAAFLGAKHALAVSSGTAALHLALRTLKLSEGDPVLCSTLTFVASANPILYEKCAPVFIDASPDTWNLDPQLLQRELESLVKAGKRLPRALVAVNVLGQSADYDPILETCAAFDIPVIEDAAESLGASYKGRPSGTLGRVGIFSFNGNKIITTSGGGMLVSDDPELIEQARFLATQAKDPANHYEHSQLGYNYRMSNLLAAVGREQLRVLGDRVLARRKIFDQYVQLLGDLPGIGFMPEASYGTSTRWLTCATIDPKRFGTNRRTVQEALEKQDIESRPAWKPLHMQPLFRKARMRGGTVSEKIFREGLCLPSGSSMSPSDIRRVSTAIRNLHHECASNEGR